MKYEGLPSPVLCCKFSQTKALLRSKEVTEWTVNRVIDFFNGLGHYKVVIKAEPGLRKTIEAKSPRMAAEVGETAMDQQSEQ